jgi:hypothetical protein
MAHRVGTVRMLLDLIADITLHWIPVLLGSGIPLFGPLERNMALRHMETRRYPFGVVKTKREVLKGDGTAGGSA